jgi:hypothetical protein
MQNAVGKGLRAHLDSDAAADGHQQAVVVGADDPYAFGQSDVGAQDAPDFADSDMQGRHGLLQEIVGPAAGNGKRPEGPEDLYNGGPVSYSISFF